jgi:hypothetical protein
VIQYRHAFRELLPQWLRGPNADSFFIEGLCALYDADRSWFQQILLNRFPSTCDPSALPLLLADRRLRRGPQTAELAVRRYLRLWWQQWQLAGLDAGLLLATQAFLAPDYPQVRIWTRGGSCTTIAKGTVGRALSLPGYAPLPLGPDGALDLPERLRWSGLITTVEHPAGTWDWDSISHPSFADRWWHFWLTIHGKPLWAPWQYGAGYQWGQAGLSWGLNYPSGELSTLDLIVRDFQPHETRCVSMIVTENDSAFDPDDPNVGNPAFGWPDGKWGYDAVDDGMGNVVPAKPLIHRYWPGIP